ncbi:MAG TPA: DUF2865 domain-containing protein [Pseudolabrys sp.]|nr:DUF2865 domain-containing protein [Pseudolabrys sp.]
MRAAVLLGGLCVMAMALPQPASAGFFDRLFGGLRRAVEAPRPPAAFVNPFTSLANHFNPPQEQLRGATATGPARAFCVRTCDGHYFPVEAHAGMSTADACHSFCPASQTRLYGGGNIDSATAPDGSRYTDLPHAFLYRKALVSGCTCNGRNAFGLAHIDVKYDPTLRSGDVVATTNGLAAYTGARNNVAEFTPVQNYSRLSKDTRDRLAETKVAPPAPPTSRAADITSSIPAAAAAARAEVPASQAAR